MTLTVESALSGLPTKPRVHELSKRIGISNKELLAALAARGLAITSASASVPREIATEVIEQYLGGAEDDRPGADVAGEAVTAGEGAGLEPDNPLFLPPVEQGAASPTTELDEVTDTAAPAKRPRRRRGRAPAPDEGGDAAAVQEPTSAERAPVPDGAVQPAEEESESVAAAEESAARGRRRRRGRRGRGRASEVDERQDDGSAASSEATSGTSGSVEAPTADSAGRGAEVPSDEEQPDSTVAAAAGEESRDGEADTDQSAASRRRRRRRRRSGTDEPPREDDPDNTVVHVREPRLSQANGPAAAAGEVQGVRGSTRLEAKRQRRRDSRESSRRRPQILTEAEFLARREAVERVMAVRQRGDLAQVALLEDGILVEHFVSQTGSDSMIGSVFLGKVQNVLPSMEAAFVDIGRGRNAVIYAGEVNWDAAGLGGKARRIETALTSGDTILAQVSKDPVGHKGARLTTQISLPGRFLVYVPGGGATGISRKLPDTERKRLKSILDRIVPEDAGVIIRTAAEGISEEELARDVERLKTQWDEISRRAEAKTAAPTQLYAEPGTLIKVVRDLFNSDITRLVVDGDEAFEPVAEYVNAVAPELADRLVRWSGDGRDVFASYRIDEQIAKALERKVHLPSGGSLVIDRTEAMTVVDVNTGKYTGSGGNLEETVTKNNLEAAEELVRQLRLRDIGGIIVIDFIDMVLESNRELVLRRLTEALGRDRTRHQVAEVTSLGLVQMTRKRMGTGLVEAFSEPCPHCGGRGILLHDVPVVSSSDEANEERRNGKGRRARGRDAAKADDIVVARVVEHAGPRRPDPRGPKPPPALVGAAGQPLGDVDLDGQDRSAGVDATAVSSHAAEGDVLDAANGLWSQLAEAQAVVAGVEAAADAGVQAAEAAADDVDEAGWRREDDIDVVVVVPVQDVQQDVPQDSGGDGDEKAARPRRRRRAAGRPAGAPADATPVDIVVRELTPDGGPTGPAPASDHPVPTTDGGDRLDQHEELTDGSTPTPPPRRRRAATRPAGPAEGGNAAVVVSVRPDDGHDDVEP